MTDPLTSPPVDKALLRQRRLLLALLLAVLASVWLLIGAIIVLSLAGLLFVSGARASEPSPVASFDEPDQAAYGLLQPGPETTATLDAPNNTPGLKNESPARAATDVPPSVPTGSTKLLPTVAPTEVAGHKIESWIEPVEPTLIPPASLMDSALAPPLEAPEPTLVPPVDWPELPELGDRVPVTTTAHFEVYAVAPDVSIDEELAARWGPELEALHDRVGATLGTELPTIPVKIAFADPYPARCPARGLASMGSDPIILVYADADTPDVQVRGVLAHEMVHQMTSGDGFVGDGVLTEGIANWGSGRMMLAWQEYPDWDAAVLDYLDRGVFVPVSDTHGLSPLSDEDCIERRDRVYNSRAAFVGWLVGKVGIETVLSMPYLEVPIRDPNTGEVQIDTETGEVVTDKWPDYKAATGYDLETLELIWLLELWANR